MSYPGILDQDYFRNLVQLTPVKFGYLGAYSTGMLRVEEMQDRVYGQMALRFTTSVLAGKTVTARQRTSVRVPASWWQHAKETAGDWHAAWLAGEHRTWRLAILPLDLILLPLASAIPRFLRRHPVRYAELAAEVRFSRDMLYPGADISLPADRFGAPVMYETLEISPLAPDGAPWSLASYGPGRFMDHREIASEVLRDPGLNSSGMFSPGGPVSPWAVSGTLEWLARHGVNVDQLVARDSLR